MQDKILGWLDRGPGFGGVWGLSFLLIYVSLSQTVIAVNKNDVGTRARHPSQGLVGEGVGGFVFLFLIYSKKM